MSEDSNITGKGADILLPPQGNPFKSAPDSEPSDDVQGKTVIGASPSVEDGVGGTEEPTDLSPADIAAMFPATQDERNVVPPPVDLPPLVLVPDEAAPAALTPDQIAEMLAHDATTTHQGARPEMVSHNGGPGRPPQPGEINLGAFNPDAPVGGSSPAFLSKAISTKVDIAAFDPDAPVEDTAPVDTGTINTDAPPPDSGLTFAPDPDLSAPSANQPTSVVLSASPTPNVGTPTASVTITTPTPAAVNPFADLPPTVLDGASSPFVEPALPAPLPAPASDSNQAAVTVSAGGSTVTASVSAPSGPDDDLSAGDDSVALPTVPNITLPVQADTHIVDRLVTDNKVDDLWQRIEADEKATVVDENSLPRQRTTNLENLKAARNLLLGGRENYEDALRYVAQVESDLFYAGRVRKWSYTYGVWVLLYDLVWIALLTLGYALANQIIGGFVKGGVIDQTNAFSVWITLLAGGLGGVSKSLWSLHQHVTKQDFDRQHLMWYFISPILGTVLGIFVYMFVQRLIIGAGAVAGIDGTQVVDKAGFVFYLLAWIVGFQQNLVLELVERVKKILLSEEEQKDAKS